MAYRWLVPAALCAAIAVLCLTSCSTGPSTAQPGTPPYYWADAGVKWQAGDYGKTLDNLSHLTADQNEFTARALPWELVVASGVARGYVDLTDACESGIKKEPARAVAIRRQMSAWRAIANSTTLELAETFQKFSKANKQESISLEFVWPPQGSASMPAQRDRLAAGAPLTPAETEALELAMLRRGVILAVARVTGAGEDAAKGQELFRKPKPVVSTETYMVGMGRALYDLAALYGPKKLDTPKRHDMMVTLASNALKPYPKNEDAADLLAKIAKETKGKEKK